MNTLTSILQATGFVRTSSSAASLCLSQGTVTRTRWEMADNYGKTAVVEVEKVNDGEERATLQPGSRHACAGIRSADELQKALDFHLFEIRVDRGDREDRIDR